MPAFQTLVNDDGNKIDDGFQIFVTYSNGYHVKPFTDRLFVHSSIAITHRPLIVLRHRLHFRRRREPTHGKRIGPVFVGQPYGGAQDAFTGERRPAGSWHGLR